jgi:hypothetical protein
VTQFQIISVNKFIDFSQRPNNPQTFIIRKQIKIQNEKLNHYSKNVLQLISFTPRPSPTTNMFRSTNLKKRIEKGCVTLTPREEALASFSPYYRQHFLPKQRLLMGQYSDDLTDPFRNSSETPNYTCQPQP